MGQALKKGDNVFFNAQQRKGFPISARVLTSHKDGTSTILSRFVVDKAGDDIAGLFQGDKHRVSNTKLFGDFADLPK